MARLGEEGGQLDFVQQMKPLFDAPAAVAEQMEGEREHERATEQVKVLAVGVVLRGQCCRHARKMPEPHEPDNNLA